MYKSPSQSVFALIAIIVYVNIDSHSHSQIHVLEK